MSLRKNDQINTFSIRRENDENKKQNRIALKFPGRGMTRCTCKKAVLTVEAAVVLPFFVCFMVFVLYFFRILQVHAGVAQALQYAGRRVAAEWNAPEKTEEKKQNTFDGEKQLYGSADAKTDLDGLDAGTNPEDSEADSDAGSESGMSISGLVKSELFFIKQLKKQKCPTQYISYGIAGISLMQSDFSGNYVDLKAVYRMKLPVRLLGNIQYQVVQEAKCRKWTGYQTGQDEQKTDEWLYYTEHGTVYHTSRTCTYLDLSIRGVPYGQAGSFRNKSGGKYHKCEKCGSTAAGHGMVYITDYGNRYHNSLTCSGLKRSIYMIRRSKATDKRMCSKCGG